MFSVIARFRLQDPTLRSNPQKTLIPALQRSHFVRLCYSAGHSVTSGQSALAEACGDRFAFGVVLYDSADVVPFGDRLAAVPLSSLWNGQALPNKAGKRASRGSI